MVRLEETDYGYKLIFEGHLRREEAVALLDDIKRTIHPRGGPFSMLAVNDRGRIVIPLNTAQGPFLLIGMPRGR